MRGQITPFVPLRAVFYFGLALAAFSFAALPAWAQFYVRSPEVEKGVAEIEEHGAFYSGPGEDERLWQTHELEGKYGITERFEVILEGEFEHPIDENFEVFSGRVMVSGLPSAPFMNLRFRAVRLTRSCSAQ
jgi:hypothetical protein